MKSVAGVAMIIAAATLQSAMAIEAASGYKVTPVQKVIQLMTGMLEKGKKEKHDEQLQFAAYKQFCDDTLNEKDNSVAEATEKLGMLKADIMKYTAQAAKLTQEMKQIDTDVAMWTGDSKAATKVRDIESADHRKTHDDYTESIVALAGAIRVLSKQDRDRKQEQREGALMQLRAESESPLDTLERADSFVQLRALKQLRRIPAETKQVVDAFLQNAANEYESGEGMEAPEPNAYEFQSSGVVDMLSKLHAKFVKEITELDKEEAESKHAFQMLITDLRAQISEGEKSTEAKSASKAKKLQAKAAAFGDLKDTMALMGADKKYLSDLTATCQQKAADFEQRQQLRAEELEAIEKAMEIIAGNKVAGKGTRLVQSHGSSLAQLRTTEQTQIRNRVVQYLQRKSTQLKSKLLSALTERVVDDPFVKVRKMIKDLMVRLMQEAGEEAEHKGWCDEELATNAQTRKEKTDSVDTLHANIDMIEAERAKLADALAELSKTLSELDEAMSKATSLRQEEKAKNFATIQDAVQAQEAVAQAITILKEFYAKSGDAPALLQTKKQEPEPSFNGAVEEESGGVVGMLEVIESDFARLESETKAGEATSQKEYDSFMSESKVNKAEKQSMGQHKEETATNLKMMQKMLESDLVGAQKELDASLQYYEKLKPSCVDSGLSYEDRVARRKEEIESLQEALAILNGDEIP